MPIVTISRQSYSRGKEVAEKVAGNLGFECISGEVLSEASDEFDVPEIELLRAVRDRPSILDQFTFGKERYIAYFQAALLGRLRGDNVVYHGLAGHYFVRDVSHVLKVRIIGRIEDRVERVLQREKVFEQAASSMAGMPGQVPAGPGRRRMSKGEALRVLQRSDEARKKWGLHLYGIDTHDPTLYDLVIHLSQLSVEEAADVICYSAGLDHLQATAESQQAMDDLALATQIKARLIERHPRIQVVAKQGVVRVALEGGSPSDEKAIREAVGEIPEVKKIETSVFPFATPD
jgi:cytidylate kinase